MSAAPIDRTSRILKFHPNYVHYSTLSDTSELAKVKEVYTARDEFKSSVCETEKSTVSKFSRTHFHELQAFNSDDTKDINRVEEFNPSFQFLLHLMGKLHFRCFQVSAVLIPEVFRWNVAFAIKQEM
ncbi:hypothetical protein KY290_008606 [Solanum tuberosum]|uniref:Uncharacterized protein n=1 Tax=Solanum tuberosum TaxID=4113 RepID=A0ABQ7WB23_SOLTU|nr:hypothetical protein KY290_008606 [Solanum tuberosum]